MVLQSFDGQGAEVALASTETSAYWNRISTKESQTYISNNNNILKASRALVWALDSTTKVYAVLDNNSKVYLGSTYKFHTSTRGEAWVQIPNNIAPRVRGVYVYVQAGGWDQTDGHDFYSGGATIYGYKRTWK